MIYVNISTDLALQVNPSHRQAKVSSAKLANPLTQRFLNYSQLGR